MHLHVVTYKLTSFLDVYTLDDRWKGKYEMSHFPRLSARRGRHLSRRKATKLQVPTKWQAVELPLAKQPRRMDVKYAESKTIATL